MGSLNEHNPSLWIQTTEETNYRPLPAKAPKFDAIVVGAGIAGLTTALLLKREGLTVAVLEAGRVATGVTGFTTAKITALHGVIHSQNLERHGADRARAYAAANADAVERIVAIAETEGIDCDLERLDAYTYAESPEDVETVRREAVACNEVGLPATFTPEVPLPFPVSGAVRLRDQAQFHPRKYVQGLAVAVHGDGSKVYEHTRVQEIEEKKRVARVKTERGALSAPWVVVASHLPFMGDGRFYAKTYPSRSYAIAAAVDGELPAGMFISAGEPVRSVRPVRIGSKRWLIIGGEGHKVGQDPETEQRYAALESWATEHFGVSSIDHRWSAQDYISVDGMPYVGQHSDDHARVFVATGFRKWGMTNGTAAAVLLTDRILGRENAHAFAFDSTRLRPKQAAKDFVREGVNVAAKLVGGKFSAEPGAPGDLKPGTAAVLEVDGEAMAIYRDETGGFHAIAPDCTHMSCRVAFNTAERSWDCPCHGSRFDVEGRVMQGPANQDLERKELPKATKRRAG